MQAVLRISLSPPVWFSVTGWWMNGQHEKKIASILEQLSIVHWADIIIRAQAATAKLSPKALLKLYCLLLFFWEMNRIFGDLPMLEKSGKFAHLFGLPKIYIWQSLMGVAKWQNGAPWNFSQEQPHLCVIWNLVCLWNMPRHTKNPLNVMVKSQQEVPIQAK